MTTTSTLPYNVEFEGDYARIPSHMQDAIRRYVVQGLKPGDFLTGVITNDLRRAVNSADEQNLPLIKLYVQWFYNEAPGVCSGSHEHMRLWMAARADSGS
jgi:hypothetical protein